VSCEGVEAVVSQPAGVRQVNSGKDRCAGGAMNKVAKLSWWSVLILLAIVVVAIVLARR
jgi:hypothetical protein